MKQRITLDAEHLNLKPTPLYARFAASRRVTIQNVPSEASGVYIRVFKTDKQGYFDCPANQNDNGDWECYIIGTCFPDAGRTFYEVRALDEDGNNTALGRGDLIVEAFSAGTAVTSGSEITVTKIPDSSGTLHRVYAVNIGTADAPEWTWRVDEAETDDDAEPLTVGVVAGTDGASYQVQATADETGTEAPSTGLVDGN